MMSAAASLGMILLWDVDGGLTQIDKFLYANEDYIKAGALLAVGVVNSGVRNECDPALALLSEYLDKPTSIMRIGAILGYIWFCLVGLTCRQTWHCIHWFKERRFIKPLGTDCRG